MAGNSPIRYAKVKRALQRGGATEGNISGSHHQWSFAGHSFSIPVHNNLVKQGYIRRLRAAWKLTIKDGVSDKAFWDGNWGS